jgi:cell wall-associated NlpC family hydrolase
MTGLGQCTSWGAALLALGLALPARAQSADPMSAFLAERGLAPAGAQAAAAPWRDRAAAMVLDAMSFLDVPYRRGGNDADGGFDCSGFTRHLFALNLGLALPRRSHEQADAAGLRAVPRHELRPGDLVFFNTLKRAFSHVGIYVGDGRFIHSPKPGAAVRIEDMGTSYWARRFDGARRPALPESAAALPVRASSPPASDLERSGTGH